MGPIRYIVILFPVLTLLALLGFFCWYWRTQRSPLAQQLAPAPQPKRRFTFAGRCHPLARRDAIPILLITCIYAVTAFAHLGSLQAPQSAWDFGDGESATFSLPESVQVSRLWYYPNLGTGKYQVEISADGTQWLTLWSRTETDETGSEETVYYWADPEGYGESYAMTQNYNQLFKWNELTFENPQYIRYLRITGQANKGLLELGEVALFDLEGNRVNLSASASPLFDEQETVPEKTTYYDSAYFDEIYHPRTAWEHIRGIEPYEISHPPLGKLIMGVGIRLFGMTPFGWRFMGTLFGVGMLPLLFVFLKNLFGRTSIATCGTVLLAADFMHLTQTRLATIDTYAFFFILLMYYFMYRYLTLPAGAPFRKCALPLFLSGLFWGIGAASKWTVIYGCTGLVVLYFIGLYQKLRDWPADGETGARQPGRLKWAFQILAFSVLVFALIPAAIYTLSYLPYAWAEGDSSLTGLVGAMWENQKYMLSYHSGVTDTHPYSSRWYQWLFDIRPILYYMDNSVPGYTTRFAAFVNPGVCWGGLLAVLVAVCVLGGGRRIVRITGLLVPFMGVPYILMALVVMALNFQMLPQVFGRIIAGAFDFRAIFGGFAGSVVMLGIKRGLYSNEAGMGSAPNAAATASVSHPVKQGLVQSLSVYIDTLVICTCSAMMVLVFYVQDPAAAEGLNGMPLVQMAVNNSVGPMGIHFITFAIFMFAYSSLIGNYFYAESNFRFIKNDSKAALIIFRLACLAVIFYGAVNSFDLAWNLADIFMGLMAMMNLIAILLLGKWALAALKDYSEQRAAGKDPVIVADNVPGMPQTDCWHLDEVKDFGDGPVKEYFEDAMDADVNEA